MPIPDSRELGRPPADRQPDPDQDAGAEDRHLNTAEKVVGVAMIFTGFLSILLSISGGFEINIVPVLLYFAGVAVWAHAAIAQVTAKYVVMAVAIVLALAFFHYGEVLFWHKQLIFWATVSMVVFFMFKSPTPK
jgi:cation transport ATPase